MHTHTLLVADDSITIQRVIQLTFANEPIRVVVATDGQEALDRIEADRPDIVLAGANVPGVDGYAIAKYVSKKRHLRKLPVLVLTSPFEPTDEQKIKESGAKGFLEKPLEPGVVITRVKHALGIQAPVSAIAPTEQAPKAARTSPRSRPTRRRSALPTTKKASTNDSKTTSGRRPSRRATPRVEPTRDSNAASEAIPTASTAEHRPAGLIAPEVLARIVGDAVAHAVATAVTHTMTAYERSHVVAPEPANSLTIGSVAHTAANDLESQSPKSIGFLPERSGKTSLELLQRDMGFDEIQFFDEIPRRPAEAINVIERVRRVGVDDFGADHSSSQAAAPAIPADAPVVAVGLPPNAPVSSAKPHLDNNHRLDATEWATGDALTTSDDGFGWLAAELGTNFVKRKQAGHAASVASGLMSAERDRRATEAVWTPEAVGIVDRVLEPVRLAAAVVRTRWDERQRIATSGADAIARLRPVATRFLEKVRGSEVPVSAALTRLARRYRSVFEPKGPDRAPQHAVAMSVQESPAPRVVAPREVEFRHSPGPAVSSKPVKPEGAGTPVFFPFDSIARVPPRLPR